MSICPRTIRAKTASSTRVRTTVCPPRLGMSHWTIRQKRSLKGSVLAVFLKHQPTRSCRLPSDRMQILRLYLFKIIWNSVKSRVSICPQRRKATGRGECPVDTPPPLSKPKSCNSPPRQTDCKNIRILYHLPC